MRRPTRPKSACSASRLLPLGMGFTYPPPFRIEGQIIDTCQHPLLALQEGLSVFIELPMGMLTTPASQVKVQYLRHRVSEQPKDCSPTVP